MTPDRRPIPRRSSERGAAFSLLELIAVAAIISTLSAIIMVRYSASLANYRAQIAADKVAADLAWAKARARATGQDRSIVVNPSKNVYAISDELMRPGSSEPYELALDADPYFASIVRITSGDPGDLTFNAYGDPNRAWAIRLRNGAAQRTVRVGEGGEIAVSVN